ncbi:hypothetical protein Q0P10_13745, partial [Staphylococcus aureus]|nr:hypothetical protein [Staphylococcus aureus]
HTLGQAFAFTESGTNLPLVFLRALCGGGDAATLAHLAGLLRASAWEHLHVHAALDGAGDLPRGVLAVQHVVGRIPAALLALLGLVSRLFLPRRS